MRTYRYKGTLSEINNYDNLIVVSSKTDYNKAPVMLRVMPAMHKYLMDISNTDAEEKYTDKTWIFDGNLLVQAIVIPSADSIVPAKVIALSNLKRIANEIDVFGPQEVIEVANPEPMSRDEAQRWISYRNDNDLWWSANA